MYARVLIDNIENDGLSAEWGLAVYIEYGGHRLILDTGTTGKFLENADRLGIDIGAVEAGVLSHAHYDHSDGLAAFFERNREAKFYLRRGAAENCYGCQPGEPDRYIGIRSGFLERFRNRIVYVDGNYELFPGAALLPHKTPGLEKIGEKAGMYVKIGGRMRPDSFAHEQSLVFDTEKGLVIFNSCSHGGADNIINEVGATYPGKRIYALIGGFHLFRSTDDEVRALAKRIRETGISRVCTGHCTGDRAMEILKEELGETAGQFCTGYEIDI